MFKRIVALTACLCLIVLTPRAASSFPGVPYDALAEATAVHIDLVALGGLTTATVDVSRSEADLSGDPFPSPATTSAEGQGVDVVVGLDSVGLLDVDLINASTTKTYDGNATPVTDNDFLAMIDTFLIDTGAIESDASSQVTGLISESTADNTIDGLDVGNALILNDLVLATTVAVDSLVNTNTDSPLHDAIAEANSSVEGLEVNVGIPALDPVVTADVLSASADATSDSSVGDADANASINCVNLEVAGNPIDCTDPLPIVTVLQAGIPLVDAVRVTVGQLTEDTADPTMTSAEAIALEIEVLDVPLLSVLANSTIVVSDAYAEANVTDFGGNSNPLAVELTDFGAERVGHNVHLDWTTASEIKHAGFRIIREEADGSETVVTPRLIASEGSELSGASYEWVDWMAPANALRYWLEDVDTLGQTTRHGPVEVGAVPSRIIPGPVLPGLAGAKSKLTGPMPGSSH